jgi:DNA-binding LacI/PurR family transcriptional regulator
MNSKYSVERLLAIRRAFQGSRLPFREELVLNYDFIQEGGFIQKTKLLTAGFPPTVILLMNDYRAMGVLKAAKELGFLISMDNSVIGFGDIPFASISGDGIPGGGYVI